MTPAGNLGPNPASLTRREGFRLISSRRVAIPVWRVDIHCRVLTTRKISATDEFVLRAIGLGVGDADGVAELLNLPQQIVDGVLSNLLADRHVHIRPGGGDTPLMLSPSGTRLVETLIEQKPVERPVQYFIDGLSGDPIKVASTSLLTSTQLDELPHLILEPDEDVDLAFGPSDTDRFIAAAPRARATDQEALLSVIGTERSMKRYRQAAGLLFQSLSDPEDLYLRICIDGRVEEGLESALRERGVVSSQGLVSRIAEDRNRIDRALTRELTGLRADDRVVESLREEIARLGSTVAVDPSEAPVAQTSPSSTRASNRLANMPVRRLECDEAPEALQLALARGRHEILISTSRFWPDDQRDQYVNLIRQLLTSGTTVNLEVPTDARQMSNVDRECLAHLVTECEGEALVVWDSKASHEANFVSVDGNAAFVFAGSPFMDLATSGERFGDDRPTVVAGPAEVQAFLTFVHRAGERT